MKRIAGIISKKPDEKSLNTVKSMLARLDHIKSEKITALKINGSVLGSCGRGVKLPEKKGGESSSVVLDGKIYNIDELLVANGLKDILDKDQEEKILALYEKRGDEIFGDFKGSYALALKWMDSFLLARDVIGKKPLYYSISSKDRKLFFGSEIKAFGKIK
jgi:asparagine synthetase B (glutamine-hydrolysing)